jgi:hypothetical protein
MYAAEESIASANSATRERSVLSQVLRSMTEDYQLVTIEATPFGNLPIGKSIEECSSMELQDIRRKNLRALIDQKFDGTIARLAELIDRQAGYVSRLLSDNPDHRRNLGEKLARQIEHATGIQSGWLDTHHELSDQAPEKSHNEASSIASREAQQLIDQIVEMDHRQSLPKDTIKAIQTLLTSIDRPSATSADFNYPAETLDQLNRLAAPTARKTPDDEKN